MRESEFGVQNFALSGVMFGLLWPVNGKSETNERNGERSRINIRELPRKRDWTQMGIGE